MLAADRRRRHPSPVGEHARAPPTLGRMTPHPDRHVTVLVLTGTRLVVAHADDHAEGAGPTSEVATATTESVPRSALRAVMLTHVVPDPASYVPGQLGREVTLTIGWGAVNRVDVMPATCGDPGCEADHGYTGVIASDDFSLRITTAADGMIALERCQEAVFDVIFMDVRMPELDGRETTRRLRAGGGPNAATPVVAVTADTAPEDVAACQAAGMAYFVSKPLTPPALIGALQHVLNDTAAQAATEAA